MKRFSFLGFDERYVSYLVIGCLCLILTACSGDDNSADHSPPSHHRIFTQSNNAILYLAVEGIDNLKIQITEGELSTNFNDTVAWGISGESEFKLSSWNRWLDGKNLLAVSEDMSNLELSLVSRGLDTSQVKWQFNSQPEGGCIIQNELLGLELALAVDTSTDPFTATMMSIDAENETQRWQLEAFAGAETALVDRCR